MQKEVAVIVGRFQTSELHSGHCYLIEHALNNHKQVLVLIGCSPLPLSLRDPLDFQSRERMIKTAYPKVKVAMLDDMPTNRLWSESLDQIIELNFPKSKAVLYGSRDCFFPYYSGIHRCVELPPILKVSATKVRNKIKLSNSKDFRAGIIYASKLPFPTSYQVVDVAVVNQSTQMVLVGHKPGDGNSYRFLGGFVDPADLSLERAAKREIFEETSGIETDDYKYLGSFRINDWRYRNSQNKVMSAFFIASYIFGLPKASDDIESLKWLPLSELIDNIISEHLPLAEALCKAFDAKIS